MFALDFISWLLSWQRGLYAENNFFKKCPFLAIFWASSFGTKFVLLEAYTWSNKIHLNWNSKEEYVCLTRSQACWLPGKRYCIELQFIIALLCSHYTMLAILVAHLRDLINIVWKEPRGRLKAKLLFCRESLIFPVYSGHVLDPSLWLWKFAGCKGAMLKG